MLTKEQIENFRITRRASPELTEDLCRLALLGLERDERQAVTPREEPEA